MATDDTTLPIAERIAQHVVETVNGVSIANGYALDLRAVRWDKDEPSPEDNLAVVMDGDPLPEEGPAGLDQFQLPVGIVLYAFEAESSTVEIGTRLRQAAATIRKALMADRHRGGLAVNTIFDTPDQFNETAHPAHVLLQPKVQFRTLASNPYER